MVLGRFVGPTCRLGLLATLNAGSLNAIDLVAGLGTEPLVGDDPGPARVLVSEHCRVAGVVSVRPRD
jgi:hypothetical protein